MTTEVVTPNPVDAEIAVKNKSLDVNLDKYYVYIRTVQATSIRTLSEALKEVLTDVNIHFDKTGIKITSMDSSNCCFVHLRLEAEKFENYYCTTPRYIGVNMGSFHKLLKSIGNNDILTLYIEKDLDTRLGIKIENQDKRTTDNSRLKLLDLDDESYDIPDLSFNSVVTMPSVDFQKYCRDLSVISDKVTITSKNDGFGLLAEGDFADKEIDIGETSNGLVRLTKKDNETVGIFLLKYLNWFCKSSGLCSTVELYLAAEAPLIVVFSVASLGKLKFGLVPMVNPDSF